MQIDWLVSTVTDKLGNASMGAKRGIAMLADASVAVMAVAVATYIRLGYSVFDPYVPLFAFAALVTVLSFWWAGMYGIVLHRSDGEVPRIILAVVVASIGFMGIMYLLAPSPNPRSLWLIYGVVLLAGTGGIRSCWRWMVGEGSNNSQGLPVAIYGAGVLGKQAMRFIGSGVDYRPVFWLDDNPEIQGRTIARNRVLDPSEPGTRQLLAEAGVQTVILAMPKLGGDRLKEILQVVQSYGCSVRTVPPVSEFVANRVSPQDLKSVKLEDLIGRPPIEPDRAMMQPNITGKSVMVTGAGGSVGGELCRQIASLEPSVLVLFELSEPSLYHIEMELREEIASGLELEIIPVLGSVTDPRKMESVISQFQVDTIFHAAAYKHVPLIEQNAAAGAYINIKGTEVVVDAAISCSVSTFVLISTDKAVRPSSMMGATKRVAEMVVQAKAEIDGTKTKFCIVRFGNVIGSSGSVIPRFQKQIESGGPVTVTHKDVNRFFMSIPEAAQLVIQAATLARNGDLLLLDMGEPIKITEVAKSLIYLHGLTVRSQANPFGDIEIEFTGLRPGEKLTEELLIDDTATETSHPKIVRAREEFSQWDELSFAISKIYDDVQEGADASVRRCVFSLAYPGMMSVPSEGQEKYVGSHLAAVVEA